MRRVILLSVFSLFLFTGCHPYGGGLIVDTSYSHNPYSPPVHAPAYGLRHHNYYYYPDAEFYFDVGRNMYFYMDTRGAWTFSVNLPIHLRSHLHSGYVEFEMENDRPYLQHKDHKYKYNSREYRNKLKYNNNNRKFETNQQFKYQEHRQDIKQKYENKEQKFENKQRDKYKEVKQEIKQKYNNKAQKYEDRQRNKYEKQKYKNESDKGKDDEDDNGRRKKDRRDERN